jgi:alpha-D-xyloside xylohydrolase
MRARQLLLFSLLQLVSGFEAPLVWEAAPWGRDALRVRVGKSNSTLRELPSALLARDDVAWGAASPVASGNLRLEVRADGAHAWRRVSDGRLLLVLSELRFAAPLALHALPQLVVTFDVGAATVFGLGQQRQACYETGGAQTAPLGRLFVPGAAYTWSLARGEGGAANTLPWLVGASEGDGAEWGLWLNVPAMGKVTFDARSGEGNRSISFELAAAAQLDYVVATTAAPPARPERSFFDLAQRFVSWVGVVPEPPEWTLGYWHSKNRYASQAELLEAARGFRARDIPVDLYVIDWLHWKVQGDWRFDAALWPDPSAMVRELAGAGAQVMVSVWPWVHNGSVAFERMLAEGWLVRPMAGSQTPPSGQCPVTERCPPTVVTMPDALHGALVDVTNPSALAYVWAMVREGYVRHGIRSFWLDSSEPEYYNFPHWGQEHWQNATFSDARFAEGGSFAEMGQLFSLLWTEAFAQGLRALGAPPVLLARAGYAGSWRNGAALWSGDIQCSFEVLQAQVRTGLSAQASGFGLWTTDIGGFTDAFPATPKCDPADAAYRELLVRWFQYGATCPIFRQHGSRATEPWLLGAEAEAIVTNIIRWRASIKPYLRLEMRKLSRTGRPINRPLWWDFPHDRRAWAVDDQYMFGDDYIAAPVLLAGARERLVYLPHGRWQHAFSGRLYDGGATVAVPAPLDSFPLFRRISSRSSSSTSELLMFK